eukprot:TRINITY_DN17142_c0_g1_i1.p1 TRINITY_DN17142_c0_g1~~TRINITY_DN17142_c0_g1_i1.p1  ORF type:complete len:138 (+),score=18.57 TRINITY_DN17142_c0_g1_i1:64-477(+)
MKRWLSLPGRARFFSWRHTATHASAGGKFSGRHTGRMMGISMDWVVYLSKWGLSLTYGYFTLFSMSAAMMSPMMFDAPGSENRRDLWVYFYSCFVNPFVFGSSCVGVWSNLPFYACLPPSWIALIALIGYLVSEPEN